MRLQLQQVLVPLIHDDALVLARTARKIGCAPDRLSALRIIRRSLDARPRNPEPVYALTVEVILADDTLPTGTVSRDIEVLPDAAPVVVATPRLARTPSPRPIVVGAGPAGLLAAHTLAQAGACPILIERGEDVDGRAPKVARFWNDGVLDTESNALYGEGGAGLFSDGKLTARGKERGRIAEFMALLHACGADDTVLVDAEPHVGSDLLLELVPRLRQRIIDAGGEVRFRARLDRLVIVDGQLEGVVVNGQDLACRHLVLAVGHSARDVYAMLSDTGVTLTAKPFAVGIRLELPQRVIDRAQYGRFAGSPQLGAASFRLTRREEPGVRACYSFCMCPGGKVIACASEPDRLTTNGMSYSKRSLNRGNAAFLVPVGPSDYPDHQVPALAGIEFQRRIERASFLAAGGTYAVPASRLTDFLAERTPVGLPADRSCPRAVPAELRSILPEFVTHTLARSLPPMLKELNGVRVDDAILYAPETRSSSPLRIDRTDGGESVNTRGLFPAGEGAGYAGGIVSSALDGRRAAEALLRAYGTTTLTR